MKYGKPVFLSNKSSLPEVGGDQAFYWENFESKYMAEVFLTNMAVYQKNKAVYKEAIIKHANSYSWDKTAKAYIEVYKNLLK